ncbi:hypothetical protein [Halosegnis longus]|uniref:DUF7847 domain-containing protein n=1 Tax=Halosegnis longus TaxID=2216012 RepID=A0AAJ4UW37_9EURY|nr:hypothetical protein [Halosegnis longus]RNJ26676.1 hypothetical protein Nmn1133_08335 [Salella cibi]
MDGPTALTEAVRELRDRGGAPLAAFLAAVGVTTLVARDSILQAITRRQELLDSIYAFYADAGIDQSQLPDLTNLATPLAVDISYGAGVALLFVAALLAEFGTIVVLRVVAGESPRQAATRRIGRTLVFGFLAGTVVRLLTVFGLVLFILPGIFIGVSLLFVHASIVIDDTGPLAAFGRSWELTSGRRFEVVSVGLMLVALYATPRAFAPLIPGTPGVVVMGAASGLALLLSAGVVGRTYLALRDGEPDAESTDDEPDDEDDPYDAALGADDLPEPE